MADRRRRYLDAAVRVRSGWPVRSALFACGCRGVCPRLPPVSIAYMTPVPRGSPTRITDWMEQFQVSYVRAVAAAAGCDVMRTSVDDGVDMLLSHRSDAHKGSGARYLEVQLKSTGKALAEDAEFISSTMRLDRYREHIALDPTVHRIVIIMAMPKSADDWLIAGRDQLMLRHCSYWANLSGGDDSLAAHPTVKARTDQIFDDRALCGIMARLGQGGTP